MVIFTPWICKIPIIALPDDFFSAFPSRFQPILTVLCDQLRMNLSPIAFAASDCVLIGQYVICTININTIQ